MWPSLALTQVRRRSREFRSGGVILLRPVPDPARDFEGDFDAKKPGDGTDRRPAFKLDGDASLFAAASAKLASGDCRESCTEQDHRRRLGHSLKLTAYLAAWEGIGVDVEIGLPAL